MELSEVKASSTETRLTFRVKDADPQRKPAIDRLLPPGPTDLKLTGLEWAGEATGSMDTVLDETSTAVPKPIVGYDLTLRFKLVGDASTPVSVEFTGLSFDRATPGQPPIRVVGSWQFRFVPSRLGAVTETRLGIGPAG